MSNSRKNNATTSSRNNATSRNHTCLTAGRTMLLLAAGTMLTAGTIHAISAIEMLWEWRGIANMAFIQLGGNSRVDEMILARVSSGFAGENLNRSMDSDKYLEGQSMQRTHLFESDHFIYWKNRFETYVKAEDLDLWHIILNDDDLKKKLAKNNEAKMVLYNALPKKEYERTFMCKTAKDIWQSLLITHQGNSQVKDNKIDLLVQQYEQFTILEEESIDSGFARFNTIITSLKDLDEGFSSKNYVRKFLRALHPKWREKVTTIKESKDLSSLALDELHGKRFRNL
ncbi:hypothetical protein Tco_1029199 [Tanacetum coccineum]|uniref:DUF4219 domain-containing protein/UBN2 domain-containing protein n=1 Tax=Tanacetum coccineum TaxID=301880 RepID=A0ABQ5G2R7_9ASTR